MRNEVSWYVLMPQKGAGFGAPRPMGSVCIEAEGKDNEYIRIPAAVARVLERTKKAGLNNVVTAEDVRDLIKNTSERVAWDVVCRMLERRDYSSKEVLDKLNRDGFARPLAQKTVERGVESGLISDERFMDAYVRGKLSSGWGKERIERELYRRGIDVKSIDGWPYEYLDPDDEYDRALEIASRKRVKEPNAFAKLVRFLINRGFSYNVSADAARKVLE